jgi:hypothetical protein
MAIGETTATIGSTAAVVSTHTVDEIDSATVSERVLQRVLLSYLTASGKALTIDADTGLPVSFIDPIEITGDITISADVAVVQVTPVITAGAYTAGDVVGGQLTFTGALREIGRGGVIQNITIVDKGNVRAEFIMVFFNASATIPANNAPFVWTAADYAKVQAIVHIPGGAYSSATKQGYHTIGGDAITTVPVNNSVIGNSTSSLFAAAICVGAPTYTSTSDLIFNLGMLRD